MPLSDEFAQVYSLADSIRIWMVRTLGGSLLMSFPLVLYNAMLRSRMEQFFLQLLYINCFHLERIYVYFETLDFYVEVHP